MADLGNITITPAPKRSDNLKTYQQNVDTWARQVEQALHQIERYLRALAAGT